MKKRLLILLTLGVFTFGMAQTADAPWRVNISANAIDIYPVGGTPSTLLPAGSQGGFLMISPM